MFFFIEFIKRASKYFVSSRHLQDENIGDNIFVVSLWISKYEKRKKKYNSLKQIITPRRYLDSVMSKSLDLNADEVIILNDLIEKDNAIRNKYIKTVTVEEEMEISTN